MRPEIRFSQSFLSQTTMEIGLIPNSCLKPQWREGQLRVFGR